MNPSDGPRIRVPIVMAEIINYKSKSKACDVLYKVLYMPSFYLNRCLNKSRTRNSIYQPDSVPTW